MSLAGTTSYSISPLQNTVLYLAALRGTLKSLRKHSKTIRNRASVFRDHASCVDQRDVLLHREGHDALHAVEIGLLIPHGIQHSLPRAQEKAWLSD